MKKISILIIIGLCTLFISCKTINNPLSGTITEIECKTIDKDNRTIPGDSVNCSRTVSDDAIASPSKASLGDY